jgi:MYXO-CTERM domain-containing protein
MSDPTTPGPSDPDVIKAEIEETRAQLGRTVDELSSRLDVPTRAKEGAARAKDTAVETYRESPPTVIAAGAALAALLGLLVWRRRTRPQRLARRQVERDARQAEKALAARRAAAEKLARKAAKKSAKAKKKARRRTR